MAYVCRKHEEQSRILETNDGQYSQEELHSMRKSVGMNANIVAVFQEWNDKKAEFEELGELLEEETDAELCEEAHKEREVMYPTDEQKHRVPLCDSLIFSGLLRCIIMGFAAPNVYLHTYLINISPVFDRRNRRVGD